MILNLVAYVKHWDVYPLSCSTFFSTQAAYAAPIIMMSQNRQNEEIERKQSNQYRRKARD
jgi:uncharacterized membrane protein